MSQIDHPVAKEPPACPGPLAEQHGPSRFEVPQGAVDTHAHVIGVPPAYPFVAERSYTPPEASPQAYLEMLDATGMTYGVLTQVSVHGFDNRRLCETLRANRRRLRGIAVIRLPHCVSPNDLYAAAARLIVALGRDPIAGKLWIVERHRIRVYRPDEGEPVP